MIISQTMEEDIAESLDILPMLSDKFVVDFVNRFHVANDHIHVQKQRTGFASRLADSLTGTATIRQAEVNTNLANGVEASLKWLSELSQSLTQSNYAIVSMNNRLNDLKKDVAKITHYSADTRQLLNTLSTQVTERFGYLESEMARIDLTQSAQINLDHVFSKWAAGKYQHLSLANRCYAALEELRWGAFGDIYRNNTHVSLVDQKRFADIAQNRSIDQLMKEINTASSTTCFGTQDWLTTPNNQSSTILTEAMAYLGDAANEVKQPFIYSATQQPKQLPLRMPRLCSPERMANAMLKEVIEVQLRG